MALLHHHSTDSVDTGLDLFATPATQTSIEDGYYVEHYPIATLTPGAPIVFLISGSGQSYTDLSHTYLNLRVKVIKADGTDLTNDDKVAPVNYYLHSLIQQVDISLNGTLITPSEITYPYRSYIEAILSYGSEPQRSQLGAALWYIDTAGQFHAADGDTNEGLKIRRDMAAQSKELDLMGRLHCDIMAQNRYMLNEVDVRIRLVLSKSAFNLVSSSDEEYKSTITQACLYVRRVRLNPHILVAHHAALNKQSALYPIKRVTIKTFSIPQGSLSATEPSLFLSQRPKRVVVGLVESAAFNGDQKKSPFDFRPHGLSHFALSVDGKHIPARPLSPNFEGGHYVRAFYNLFTETGVAGKDAGLNITYRDYPNGFFLVVCDISPSLLDGDAVDLVRSGGLTLEMKFRTALTHPLHCLVMGELDSVIEIDKTRQVLVDVTS